jgi:hypothetical protein
MVNFDLHQDNPGRIYDNVELDLFGDWLNPGMVRRWYDLEGGPGIPAWGVPPLVRSFPAGMLPEMPDRGGIEITWVDKFDPYEFCETHHFGLEMDPLVMGPVAADLTWVQAYWTTIRRCPVPVPWQFWDVGDGVVRDIIRYDDPDVGPVWVNRQVVVLPFGIPLDGLTWDEVEGLPWEPVPGDPVLVSPGEILVLEHGVDRVPPARDGTRPDRRPRCRGTPRGAPARGAAGGR